MAAIYSLDGNELTTGLQGCKVCDEAIQAACRAADDRGEDVELEDDDGYWLVHPATWSGGEHGNPVRKHREAADFICSLEASEDEYNAGYARLSYTAGEIAGELQGAMSTRCRAPAAQAAGLNFIACESADGWSLHAPGSTDEQIASGDAPALADGPWTDGEHIIPEWGYIAATAAMER